MLLCRDKIKVNIELKEETQRVVKPTLELVQKLGMLDQVCFSSFTHSHKAWLEEARAELRIEQPLEFAYLVWQLDGFGDLLEGASGPDVLTLDIDLLEKYEELMLTHIKKAKAKGMKLKFYFCFEKEESEEIYSKLERVGADGLIINCPAKIKDYKDSRKEQ